jgi:hypothetical protein
MNITLHIERLILDGVPIALHHRSVVQAALEAELTMLLSTGSLDNDLLGSASVPGLRVGNVQLSSDGNPHRLGIQIAQAIYSGIGQAER